MRATDPRVIRTRQMLRDALIALILEKGYDAVNIQDIALRAGLRRATFYLHYRDKEELLLTILHDLIDGLLREMALLPQSLNPEILSAEQEHAEEIMTFRHVQQHANLYRAVFSGQGAAEITRNLREYLAVRIRQRCFSEHRKIILPLPIDVLASYLAGVKLSMILWWLEQGMPYSPEQMADMCTRLMLDGASGSLKDLTAAALPTR